MAFMEDPTQANLQRIQQLDKWTPEPLYDEKETRDREAAAQAYAGENQEHFVGYLEDCVQQSVDAMRQIRRNQLECWQVFNEEEPAFYAQKEPWQSKVVVPKPYGSVLFAAAVTRKAFDAQYLSIENEQNQKLESFWTKCLTLMLSKTYGDFPLAFMDSAQMSFAIGTSMEMLPVWRPGLGLRFINVEPWKIHRDPDSVTRKSQSGMYWIHQEYQDLWLIKKYGADGRYVNTEGLNKDTDYTNKIDPNLSQWAVDRRRGMSWRRSNFRTMMLTSEFWGTILSPRGELLLPNSTYTVAADRVVRLPKSSPYPKLRWPGSSFSVLPHLLRYDGRGLVHGIKSLWYFMNGLLSLHNDALNWLVNPTSEITTQSLVDPTDVDDFPGKKYLVQRTEQGQQVVRYHDRRSVTGDVLANLNFADQRYQEGSFVTSLVQGLPGYRAEVTAREAAQSLEQALNIFSLIGKNLEGGALDIILGAAEVIRVNMTYGECAEWLGKDEETGQLWADMFLDPTTATRLNIPSLTTGSFHVSGMTALMRDWETVRNIKDIILPCLENEYLVPFFNKYGILKALETRLNLRDENILLPIDMALPLELGLANQFQAEIEAAQQIALAGAEQASRQALSTPVAPPPSAETKPPAGVESKESYGGEV